MAEDGSVRKKPRTQEKFQLFYWPGIPGRGEPIRLVFEEAGVDYEDVVYTKGIDALTSLMGTATHYAPPILHHGDIDISQLPNILQYLGEKLKLVPEDEAGKLRVNQLTMTCCDVQNEAHDVHHPVSVNKYYEEQKDVALLRAVDFRNDRIPKYFKHLEAALEANKESNGEWLVGPSLTYADLMLFHLVDGLKFAFPKALASYESQFPRIFALHKRVAERPRIKAYLASDKRQKYGEGIFRHYEVLDVPPQ